MGYNDKSGRPFDIPEVPDFIPRKLKPWLFIFFVLIIQFSGGLYLAAASDMVGTTALMKEDILMAGYASLVGMSINFAVMFRIKFRFSTRVQLLASCTVLIIANLISVNTTCVPLLVTSCFIAGWFRMQATFACNSTIQLWITPVRDMSIFFCYVYIIVDSVIQLSGIAVIYTSFNLQWEYMQWLMIGLLVLEMIMVMWLVRPIKSSMYIPLLGIDWIGSILWTAVMLCFTFICVYGNYYDWWESSEITYATALGIAFLALNCWRASFLHHPYISFRAMKNRNVIRAIIVYIVFFTLLATEHVFEHSYASQILGFDDTNIIDLNWYVLIGIIIGCIFTYYTFALRKWRYRTMTLISFALAGIYLAFFYFRIDYVMEKETLLFPLLIRGIASVIISIVFLTSIVQSGLPFTIFPQALTLNGFTGAVMGATLGPAIVGELLSHIVACNYSEIISDYTNTIYTTLGMATGELASIAARQALLESMKEIYGILLIVCIISLALILVMPGEIRPSAFFPKWRNIRRIIRRESRKAVGEQAI